MAEELAAILSVLPAVGSQRTASALAGGVSMGLSSRGGRTDRMSGGGQLVGLPVAEHGEDGRQRGGAQGS
jgi:hypothetical protein